MDLGTILVSRDPNLMNRFFNSLSKPKFSIFPVCRAFRIVLVTSLRKSSSKFEVRLDAMSSNNSKISLFKSEQSTQVW
ncbi:hypothetical protein BEN44_20115 [Leptospira interrogans serovar Ricardi]|nr:hypothetical protein [Leptospira interrogans serovar Ricardi]